MHTVLVNFQRWKESSETKSRRISYIFDTRNFHVRMACACTAILTLSIVGCRLTSIQIADGKSLAIALVVSLAAFMPLPLYWHERQRMDMREGALVIPWALILAVILPFSVDATARLGMPLQDANLVRIDRAFGFNVLEITAWASHHWLGSVINRTYPLLLLLLPVAAFGPALAGKWAEARDFVAANIAAFVIGLAAFALIPAIGPWYGYHVAGGLEQIRCQTDLLLLRVPGPYIFHPAGIVCFPSFHVIWAILCARALWGFRFLRFPVILLSGMIILSTLTTGWHYFADVLAGAIVAALSISLSARHNRAYAIQ